MHNPNSDNMEAKDLMIGDWVIANRYECVGDGGQYAEWKEIGKVTRIYEDMATLLFPTREDDWEEIDLKDIEPIPLTEEILLKNGWTTEDFDTGFYKGKVYFGVITIIVYMGKVWSLFDGNVTILYVHELQHAINLCGLIKDIVV